MAQEIGVQIRVRDGELLCKLTLSLIPSPSSIVQKKIKNISFGVVDAFRHCCGARTKQGHMEAKSTSASMCVYVCFLFTEHSPPLRTSPIIYDNERERLSAEEPFCPAKKPLRSGKKWWRWWNTEAALRLLRTSCTTPYREGVPPSSDGSDTTEKTQSAFHREARESSLQRGP